MSEHALPPDPSEWPSDPFRLLGVTPGTSSRDLRKAYLHLIRSYKPEHHPDEFQKIRQAYEAALAISRHFSRPIESLEEVAEPDPEIVFQLDTGSEPADDFRHVNETSNDTRPEPSRASADPWKIACDGDPKTAYKLLVQTQEAVNGSEETYLQLYWLVNLIPDLDPARLPLDWLIRGLGACGPGAGRLRELLRRELTADASLALRERVFVFFRRSAPPALAHDVAIPRWKAARDAGRWGLILADVQSLRNWLPETDNDTWARLLLAASANLVWAERPDSEHAAAFCLEVEQLAHRNDDYAAELYQIEFAQIVKAGLDRLGGRNGGTSGLFALLACSWDDPGPELRSRLRFYIDQLAREPALALEGMDRIFGVAPAVLGRISALFGGLDSDDSRLPPRKDLDDLAPTIERFLAEHRWTEYRSLRLPLLRFCIQEAISPGLVSRILAERPSFVLTGKSPLAQSIADDWPLRHVYRATELRWNEPAEFAYGS